MNAQIKLHDHHILSNDPVACLIIDMHVCHAVKIILSLSSNAVIVAGCITCLIPVNPI